MTQLHVPPGLVPAICWLETPTRNTVPLCANDSLHVDGKLGLFTNV